MGGRGWEVEDMLTMFTIATTHMNIPTTTRPTGAYMLLERGTMSTALSFQQPILCSLRTGQHPRRERRDFPQVCDKEDATPAPQYPVSAYV